jgi:hypothetical protein
VQCGYLIRIVAYHPCPLVLIRVIQVAMNPFKLAFDHTGIPARVTITVETWLSFARGGAGDALYSVAFAGTSPVVAQN